MPVITDTNSRRILVDVDGQGIEGEHINDAQLYAAARMQELLASTVPDLIDDPTTPGSAPSMENSGLIAAGTISMQGLAFAPYPNTGYIKANATPLQLETVPGLVMQMIGTAFDGTGESFPAFRLPATTLTCAVGDATNPRIDIVEIKLEYVDAATVAKHFEDATTRAPSSQNVAPTRGVQCTIQIKAGTPAVTPSFPTPTAGFVALGGVFVPATMAIAHEPHNIFDLRMPLGKITVVDVQANQMIPEGADWSLATPFKAISSAGAGTSIYAMCPIGDAASRLVGIGLLAEVVVGATCKLVTRTNSGEFALADLINLLGSLGFRAFTMVQLMDQIAAQATTGVYDGVRAANTRVGTPLWCNGYPGGPAVPQIANDPGGDQDICRLGLEITTAAAGAALQFVRFYVAQGL